MGTKEFNRGMLKERKLIFLLPQHLVSGRGEAARGREGQAVLDDLTA